MTHKSKNLIIEGFKFDNENRMKEIFNCARWNSKIIDNILFICVSDDSYEAFKPLESEQPNIKVQNIRPYNNSSFSIQDIFGIANSLFPDDSIKLHACADIILSEKCREIDVGDSEMMVLTDRNSLEIENQNNYPIDPNENGTKLFNETGVLDPFKFVDYTAPNLHQIFQGRWLVAQSTWIWKTPKVIGGNCTPGYQCGESILMHYIREAGYKIISGALIYPTYHNHLSQEKTQRYQQIEQGPRSQVYSHEVL